MGNIILLYVDTNETFSSRICSNNRYKIVLLKNGSVTLTINNSRHTIQAPCLLYLNERDHVHLISSDSMDASTVYFHPNVLNAELDFNTFSTNAELISEHTIKETTLLHSFYKVNGLSYPFITLTPKALSKIELLVNDLERELTHQYDAYWASRSRSYLIQILFFIRSLVKINCLDIPQHESLTNQHSLVRQVKLYLTHHYDEHILLDDLASQFGVNKRTLNRLFLQYTGTTSNKFLVQYRIEVAESLLKNTYLPIIEIAKRTGFSDMSYFGKVFKKYNGVSPKSYRNTVE